MNGCKVRRQMLAVALVVLAWSGVAAYAYEWEITDASATFYPVESYSSGSVGLGKALDVYSVSYDDPGACIGGSSCTVGGSVNMSGGVWSNTGYEGGGGSISLGETGGGGSSLELSWSGPPGTSPGADIGWSFTSEGRVSVEGHTFTQQGAGYASCTASAYGGGAGCYSGGDNVVAMGSAYGTAECDEGTYTIYTDAWADGTDPGDFDYECIPGPDGFDETQNWADWDMWVSGGWEASAGTGVFVVAGSGTGGVSVSAYAKPGEPGYCGANANVDADSSLSVSVSTP